MKRNYLYLLLTILLLGNFPGYSQKPGKVSRVKIYANADDLKRIKLAGVEFDHGVYDHENGTFENEFYYDDVMKIKALGLKVRIVLDDVFGHTDSLNRVQNPYMFANDPVHIPAQYNHLKMNFTTSSTNFESFIATPSSFSLGSMGGFYNLTELEAEIDAMVAEFPGLVEKQSIGTTGTGTHTVWRVKISDNVATDESEAEVLYTGMHHSREGMSMMNLIFFMRYLLENYDDNSSIKDIVDNRELFFVPVVNVDGFNYNTTASNWSAGRKMRRKNLTETTGSAAAGDGSGGDGVDINRNYGRYWGLGYSNSNTASSGTGNSDAYRGTAAFSEVETQNMRDFILGRNFKIALNYHCYGNWWIRPQGPDSSVYGGITLNANAIATYGALQSLFSRYNCYVYGTANQTVYDVNGYSDDWLFTDRGIYAFSPEIGSASDGFWCSSARIIPIAKELIFPNIQAAYSAGSYAELQDTSATSITTTDGAFGYTVTRKGLTNETITVTLIPLNNIQSVGSPVTFSIADFGGTTSGTIDYELSPSLTAGSLIRYMWRVETGGIKIEETITKIYSPTPVFTDDMETAGNFNTNWVRTGTGSAWAYSAGGGIEGSSCLTESPAGNYSNSADHGIKLASPLNLSASTKVYLSYLIKYNTENCQDRLQVEISTTGVNGTYTPIATSQTIKESRGSLGGNFAITGNTVGWVRDVIDLTSYAGNNNIGLRFRFLSNGSNLASYSREGFSIDNISVFKTNAALLPVSFEDISATRTGESVLVKWKSVVTGAFSHYEIQRSSDGVNFQAIGQVPNPNASSFTDTDPIQGRNYYRVQAVEANGNSKLSKTVVLVFMNNTVVSAYPNPLTSVLNVDIQTEKSGNAVIEMSTIEGKIVYKKDVVLRKGKNVFQINTSSFASQQYIVNVRDNKGEIIRTIKVIKGRH